MLVDPLFHWLPLVGLGILLLSWVTAFITEKSRPTVILERARGANLFFLLMAVISLVRVVLNGAWSLDIGSLFCLPVILHFDALTLSMLTLIALIGAVCVRFSLSYLDGDLRQARFLAHMQLTIIAVACLVLAGSLLTLWLAWVACSMALSTLLLFHKDRVRARVAERKKFWVSRYSDLALGISFLLLGSETGTTDIVSLRALIGSAEWQASLLFDTAMVMLVLAALLKSAQMPSHSWLTEVMETPTPVSALLHAGLVNAGGVLVLRFADLMLAAPYAMTVLAVLGGVTALSASLIMLFQTSVKVSLAWSTVAQMGFMMLQCGLGAFYAAALHIVAHSFYKAHSFLSSGSVVDTARIMALAGPAPSHAPSLRAVFLLLASGGYFGALHWLGHPFSASHLFGLIAVIGLAQFILDESGSAMQARLLLKLLLVAGVGAASFTALHAGAQAFLSPALPAPGATAGFEGLAMGFAFLFVAVALLRGWLVHPAYADSLAALRVHLANGLYIGLITDRLVGRYHLREE